jgi:hypothetical protein
MRNLGRDVYSVVHMALIASLSLDEPLAVQNAEKLSLEEFRFIVPRLLIEKQEWAAMQAWELAKALKDRFEAAYRGLFMF